jgi:ABC-type transport system substrate-binding protein
VEVKIEAYTTGDDDLYLQAYDGTTWGTPVLYDVDSPTDDDAYDIVGVSNGLLTWGDMSNAAVRVIKEDVGTAETVYLDEIEIRVKIAPSGFAFGATANGMYVEYKLRPNMNWTDGHNGNPPITSADVAFTYDLIRFQDNIRYRGSWEKVYKIDVIDGLTVRIWYVDKFVYHFEEIGLFLYAPKHIWEDYIGPEVEALYEPFQDAYHDFWIGWDRHHSEWRGWENQRSEMADYPGYYWTDLVGAGSFVYPHGGWEPGVSYRMLANRDCVVGRICRSDVDINGICDMRDVFQVLYRQGATPGSARWKHELYSMQGPAADIAPPCQWIGGEEIYVLKTHFGHKWVVNDTPVLPPPCD